MYIFDNFHTDTDAVLFAAAASMLHRRDVAVFYSAAAAQAADPFPAELVAPVVHVERDDDDTIEAKLEAMVAKFRGSYRGT